MDQFSEWDRDYEFPYRLGADDLRRLDRLLREKLVGEPTVTVELVDGTTRKLSVANLIEYKNSTQRRLRSIEIKAGQYVSNGLKLTFSREYSFRTLNVHATLPDEKLTVIRQELDDILFSLKPPTAWVNELVTLIAICVGLATFGTPIGLWIWHNYNSPIGPLTVGHTFTLVVAVGAWVIVSFVIAGLVGGLIDHYFPKVVFLIGDEIEDAKRRATTRNYVLGAVVMAFALSFLASWLANRA